MQRKKKPPPDAAGDAKAILAALNKGFYISPGSKVSLVNGVPDETSLGLQRTLVANPYFDVDMDKHVGTADLLLALSMTFQESMRTGSVRSFCWVELLCFCAFFGFELLLSGRLFLLLAMMVISGGSMIDHCVGKVDPHFVASVSPIYRTLSKQEVSSTFLEKMSRDIESHPVRSKDLFATRARQIFACADWQKDRRLSVEEFAELLWADQYPINDVPKTIDDIREEGVDQKGA